jgi:hypothetical protein
MRGAKAAHARLPLDFSSVQADSELVVPIVGVLSELRGPKRLGQRSDDHRHASRRA